jgi:hypothetical protein
MCQIKATISELTATRIPSPLHPQGVRYNHNSRRPTFIPLESQALIHGGGFPHLAHDSTIGVLGAACPVYRMLKSARQARNAGRDSSHSTCCPVSSKKLSAYHTRSDPHCADGRTVSLMESGRCQRQPYNYVHGAQQLIERSSLVRFTHSTHSGHPP